MEEIINDDLEQKICEFCGETFGCGAKLDGCWCTEVKISEHIAEGLKAKFRDCLCQICLKNFRDSSVPVIARR